MASVIFSMTPLTPFFAAPASPSIPFFAASAAPSPTGIFLIAPKSGYACAKACEAEATAAAIPTAVVMNSRRCMISSYEVRTYWTTTLGRAQGCQQAAGIWAGDLTTSILSANLIVHYITPRIVTNTCKVAGKTLNLISPLPSGSAAEKVRKNAPYETRPPPGRGPETVTADGGAIILTGHETTAFPRRRGTLRSLWRTHRGRHRLAASHLSP